MSITIEMLENKTNIVDFDQPCDFDGLIYGKFGKYWRFAVKEDGIMCCFVGELFTTENNIKMAAFDYAVNFWNVNPDKIPQKFKLARSGLNITQEEIGAIQTARDNLKHSVSEMDQMTWFYLDSLLSKLTK